MLPPSELKISLQLKRSLGCISYDSVQLVNPSFPVRIEDIHYHDMYHLEVSLLPRIQIGTCWVSGIHGTNSPVFHDTSIVEEYDGILDEARVAVHEGLTQPSFYTIIKLIIWGGWFMAHGINPFAVIYRHYRSLKNS